MIWHSSTMIVISKPWIMSSGKLFDSTVLSVDHEEHRQDLCCCTVNLLSECIPQFCELWITSAPFWNAWYHHWQTGTIDLLNITSHCQGSFTTYHRPVHNILLKKLEVFSFMWWFCCVNIFKLTASYPGQIAHQPGYAYVCNLDD